MSPLRVRSAVTRAAPGASPLCTRPSTRTSKRNRTPVGLEARAQHGQDAVQAVGADVGARVVEDLRRRAARDQLLQQRHLQRVFHARVELAVGVGAGAALAEEEVAFGIGLARAVEAGQRAPALPEHGPAFQDLDGDTAARQHQRGEEAGRAGAHHRDPCLRGRRMHRLDRRSARGAAPARLVRRAAPSRAPAECVPASITRSAWTTKPSWRTPPRRRASTDLRAMRKPRSCSGSEPGRLEGARRQHALGLVEPERKPQHAQGLRRRPRAHSGVLSRLPARCRWRG